MHATIGKNALHKVVACQTTDCTLDFVPYDDET